MTHLPFNSDQATGRWFPKWCAITAGLVFLLQLWLFRPFIRDYFPTADELALEVASTNIAGRVEPWTWVSQGFHSYFNSYAEWQTSQTDFWRPLANVLFWLHYQLFGADWSVQLIFGYLAHALMVGMTGYVACRVFRLNSLLTAAAMTIAAVNPAFWSPNDSHDSFAYNSVPELIQYPIFQSEILCALLMMCAFLAFISRRYVLFCIVTTVALLLKETALTLPVSALAISAVWWKTNPGRSNRNVVWLALPLLLWYLARLLLFDYGKANYVLTSATEWGWLLKPIRHLLYLPSLLYRGPLSDTKSALVAHDTSVLALHGFQIAVNTAWWLVLLYAVRRAWVEAWNNKFLAVPEPWVCGLIFALGNLCLVLILQSADPRFTYFWFALGPAAVFAALSNRRHPALISMTIALSLILPQAWAVERALSAAAIRNYQLAKQSAKSLTSLLGHMPATVGTVYLIDDVILQGTAPEYLAKFAGFRGNVIVINSIEPILGCNTLPQASSRYRLTQDFVNTHLEYTAPPCFYKVNEAPLPLFKDDTVARGKWITYHFTDMKRSRSTPILDDYNYDPGDRWNVTVSDPSCATESACAWLGLDPAKQDYYVLTKDQ